MDNCPDCGRMLRNSVCLTCSQIVLFQRKDEMACWNCGKKTLVQISPSRSFCEFCQYKYVFTKNLKRINMNEILRSIELSCNDCGFKVQYQSLSEEFVCSNCGLVAEDVIAVEDDNIVRTFRPTLNSQLDRYFPFNSD